MSRFTTLCYSAVLALALAACQRPPVAESISSRDSKIEAAPPQNQHGEESCPFEGGDVAVMVADIPTGISLTMTSSGEKANAVRVWAAKMASSHAQQAEAPTGHGDHGDHGDHGGEQKPASTLDAEDVPNGARIVLRSTSTDGVASLREHARGHAETMRAGQCPHTEEPHAH